jgi:predicted molibdopterin-dependent oxidoreductase YjgC
VTERSPPGTVFMSFHFPDETHTNLLSSTALDPTTLTPEFKACAVRIVPA